MHKLITTLVLILVLLFSGTKASIAQTTLSVGEIAIIGLNSDGDDEFSFLLLKDITAGTSIYVTDKGWNDASGFVTITGDGIWQWSTAAALSAGTIIHIKTSNNGTISAESLVATPGTVTWVENNGTSISYAGDQVFIYQGTAASPTFITGCTWNVESYSTSANWDGSCAAAQTSALPDQLTNGVNAIWLYGSGPTEFDNFRYKCSALTSGTPSTLRTSINNINNWDVDGTGTTAYTLNPFPCTFSVVFPPTVTTSSASSITATTATGNGNITAFGSTTPTQYGVVWSTSENPTIDLSTKTTQGAPSGTGAFTSSITNLTANNTYHVRAYATNTAGTSYGAEMDFTTLTAGTWMGATSSDWGTSTNWAGGAVPTSATDVTIPDVTNDPIIGATTAASCNNLTVTGSLTIESSAAGSGSLIVSETPTGNVIYNRHLTGGATWHLIAAPVNGHSIQTFVQAAGNAIATNSDKYGMGPYTENTNSWNLYTTGNIGTAGNFTPGKGYEALRTADGTVTFTGVPVTSGSATLYRTAASNSGWNLVGNPFTSYMRGNTNTGDANNFLTVNSGSLRADFIGLYYWTGAAYETINQSSGANYIAPGQGFFVRALDNSGKTVSFTSAMRTHTAGTFKSTSTSWPEIELIATASGKTGKTVIRFIPDMTIGLDPGYDAGAFEQEPDFGISTRLVENNGINFAIQCLPDNPDNLIVPIGLMSKTTSGEITFSFRVSGIDPQNIQLEDHQAGVLRTIDSSNGTYTATIEAGEPVYGRFFLRIGQTSSTAITELQPVKAWYRENKIIIEGITEPGTRAELYDLQGRQIASALLNNYNPYNNYNNYNTFNNYNNPNFLPSPSLRSGLYLLRIGAGGKVQTVKVAVAE